jgi:CRISPR-associated protein Csm5
MNFDYTIFEVTARLLTPLHIGSGTRLLKDYDYAVAGKRTWRLNQDAILETQDISNPELVERLAAIPPAQLLKPADFKPDSPFFRYRMDGEPRASGEGAELQEQLKTVQDEVYLPGSSLKGAIRTALAWHGWAEQGQKPDSRKLERDRRFAGRRIEQEIMGRDPNHDLLRALHISDSAAAGPDRLMLLNAQVLTRGGLGAPVELEAVRPDTVFQLTIKVDQALFSRWAKQNGLQLGGNQAWLEQLTQIVQQHTRQRLSDELAWYREISGAQETAGFFQEMLKLNLPAGRCLLQLGWGGGWGDKTYGDRLQADGRFMEHIIAEYRLARGRRRKGDPFPKSRRVTARVVRDHSGQVQQRASLPLGWMLLELEERRP